ncbi:flagellar basal body-associated protein FliL [Pistricoccus aurantiacus]|uniref:Flagellar protein FliL n=1 Tax=Pistricoccus aurantiacus TaxID=1883414 RepID=A0A5B8SY03_9GAMM|nr:flagellar basal body-associated protein FliL [Pistricoccus aurantiacus]QEA39700.1 flagellar basal body-associated protein FliL [Pistricoccus aurantiacus]
MADSEKSSGKLKWLVIALLFVMAMVITGMGAYLFLGKNSTGAEQAAAFAPIEAPTPLFVKIAPFTVNLTGDDAAASRLLYLGLSLRVGDATTQTLLTDRMPQIRSRLLMLLSGKSAQELTSPEGKAKLAEDIKALFDKPLSEPQPTLALQEVLFTEFIVQ